MTDLNVNKNLKEQTTEPPRESREFFKMVEKERGAVANIHKAFSCFPQGLLAHYDFYKEIILNENLPLSRAEREFLAVKTSLANSCRYCISHHQVALENREEELKKELSSEVLVFFERLATELTLAPSNSSSLKDEALALGLSLKEFSHAVMVVSYFNFANRLAFAMGLELESGYQETCN